MSVWIYWQSESGLWTVGYYTPTGERVTDSDHDDRNAARERVHYLNGGRGDPELTDEEYQALVDQPISKWEVGR